MMQNAEQVDNVVVYFVGAVVRHLYIYCIACADAFSVHSRLHDVTNPNSAELRKSVLYHVRHGPSTMGPIMPNLF